MPRKKSTVAGPTQYTVLIQMQIVLYLAVSTTSRKHQPPTKILAIHLNANLTNFLRREAVQQTTVF